MVWADRNLLTHGQEELPDDFQRERSTAHALCVGAKAMMIPPLATNGQQDGMRT